MAKPYEEITKTQFNQNYNVVKILTDKSLIMKQLQTFNSNNEAVAFDVKKKRGLTIDEKIDLILDRLDNLENLVITQFKQHGWIKK